MARVILFLASDLASNVTGARTFWSTVGSCRCSTQPFCNASSRECFSFVLDPLSLTGSGRLHPPNTVGGRSCQEGGRDELGLLRPRPDITAGGSEA